MHKRLIKYITLLLFVSTSAYPQITSVNGDFEINTVRGCINLDVSITNLTSPQPTEVVLYSFHGLNPDSVTANNNYTYFDPGTYWVYQIIQTPSGATGKADSVRVEVFDNPAPSVELLTCNNNEVIVNILDNFYDVYEIDYGDGSPVATVNAGPAPPYAYGASGMFTISVTGLFTTGPNNCGVTSISFDPLVQVQPGFLSLLEPLSDSELVINYTLAANSLSYLEYSVNSGSTFQSLRQLNQNTTADTITSLDLANQAYCYRIATYDACSNFRSYSNIGCTINLSATAANNLIDLSWQTPPTIPLSAYNILRNTSPLASVAGGISTYADSTVECGLDYCYIIEVDYGNGAISRSLPSCATAFSTDQPVPPAEISSVKETDQTTFYWTSSGPGTGTTLVYTLRDGRYQVIDSTTQASYTLAAPETCLRLATANSCGLVSSLSAIACPIALTATSFETGNVALNWTLPTGWSEEPTNFAVVIYNADFTVRDSIVVTDQLYYVDLVADAPEQFAYYTVYALSPIPGVVASRSEILPLTREPQILLPNTFTPNNDGLNDVFEVQGKFVDSNEVLIYNRWGNLIYYNGESLGWDGTTNGSKAPPGNYSYKVVVKDFDGREYIRTGSILILSQ